MGHILYSSKHILLPLMAEAFHQTSTVRNLTHSLVCQTDIILQITNRIVLAFRRTLGPQPTSKFDDS
jgi:hypothetical protein